MFRCNALVMALLAAAPAPSTWAATHESPGKIDAVTVYRGQALVTRLVDVPGPPGLREVVVTDLPDRVVPASIYAESADGVVVRSVRYRVRPVAHDVRDEVRALDAKLAEKRDALDALSRARRDMLEERAYLDRLNEFTAPTASAELRSGVLNAETLQHLTLFVFEQRRRLSDEELTIDRQSRALEADVSLLQRNRDELTGVTARTAREAVVFVELRDDAGGEIRLRYLVDEATWSPSYNVRRETDRVHALLEYNAAVQQRSGEDWTDVAMTLSTATPTLVARAPELTPLRVSLADMIEQDSEQYRAQFGALLHRKKQMESNRNAPMLSQKQQIDQSTELWTALDNRQNDLGLNSIAAELQVLDLVAPGRARMADGAWRDEGISVTYMLSGRTSLPSRSDRQSIQIAALELPASFYKVATPVLTDFIYDEAQLTNDSRMVLLAGPVLAYSAGQFVGHGEIPTVASGERFDVGFGIDSSLRAGRELVDRSESIRGGNRIVKFRYKLTVSNFASAAAGVRLLDRLPKAKDSAVQVTLADNGPALSTDREYTQGPRKDGILRWDAQVPASANGLDAFALEYEFQLEYDKAKSLTGLALAE